MQKVFGIVDVVGEAAALEQLAEESTELAKAALKLARIVRAENPTPVDYDTAFRSLVEELGDVRVCVAVLHDKYGTLDTSAVELKKLFRRKQRLHEHRTGEEQC